MTTVVVPEMQTGFEAALLRAVCSRLRFLCGFNEHQINIEHDVFAPATQGHWYCSVSSAGCTPGQYHQPQAGQWHWVVTAQITVAILIGNVALDRRRKTYAENFNSLDSRWMQILVAIGNGYHIENEANTLLVDAGDVGKYSEGIMVNSLDPKPEIKSVFGENQDPAGAMVRGFRLVGSYFREV